MDRIMEPTSWFETVFYKPIYVVQTMIIAIPWKVKCGIPATKDRVLSFFKALRTCPPPFTTDSLKIGAAGFCWGGKHAIVLAQDASSSRVCRHKSQKGHTNPESLIDCVFTAHPSYVDVPKDVDAIKIPISVAVGDNDMALKMPLVQEMKEILETKSQERYQVNVIPGAKHGFAVRTHPDDDLEMEAAENAELQAIEWFNRWFI